MTPSPPRLLDADASRLRQDVLEWFVRRHREDWRAPDEHDFQAWLGADPRHGAAYAQWESRWETPDAISPETVTGWRRALADQRAAAMPARRSFLKPAMALAAAGLVVGMGHLGWRLVQAQPVFEQAFATRRGQLLEVPLPDGTRLWLDTATRMEVRLFRDRREVTLIDGQAVFLVNADAARPFDVLAGPLKVRLPGARAAVRHTPDVLGAEGARVSVDEGMAWVTRRGGGGRAVFLAAGEQVASDALGTLAAVSAVPGEGIAPWQAHRLSFVDAPLPRVLAELERYGNTGLVARDPAVAALRLTGTFDPRDMPALRRALPGALPVRLKDAGPVAEVVPAP